MMNTAMKRYVEEDWIKNFHPEKRRLTGRSYLIAKRFMDLTLVLLSSPMWVPFLGIIALFIAVTSPGAPVMFTQWRTGRGGKRFRMYKFRSMVPNAEELKMKYAHLNELQWPDFKITNDPRITKVGKILRKTSLDELPQLINILKGEMSLVGPRPIVQDELKHYKKDSPVFLSVRPGLTGLWQVSGRSDLGYEERVNLDIYYVQNWSFWLDIKILIKTVGVVLKRRGAQ